MIKKQNDCCCTSWKDIVKQLWEKYQEIIKVIRFNGKDYYPNGDGRVEIPVRIGGAISLTDMETYWTLAVVESETATLTEGEHYWTLEVM